MTTEYQGYTIQYIESIDKWRIIDHLETDMEKDSLSELKKYINDRETRLAKQKRPKFEAVPVYYYYDSLREALIVSKGDDGTYRYKISSNTQTYRADRYSNNLYLHTEENKKLFERMDDIKKELSIIEKSLIKFDTTS